MFWFFSSSQPSVVVTIRVNTWPGTWHLLRWLSSFPGIFTQDLEGEDRRSSLRIKRKRTSKLEQINVSSHPPPCSCSCASAGPGTAPASARRCRFLVGCCHLAAAASRQAPPGPARSRVQPSRQRPRRRAGLLVRSEKRFLKPSEARSAILRLMAAAVVLPVVPSAAARGSEARPSLSGERPTVSAGARQRKGAQRNSSR